MGRPADSNLAAAISRAPEVTTAQRSAGLDDNRSTAPAIAGTSVAISISSSVRTFVASALSPSPTSSATTSDSRRPCWASRWKSKPGAHVRAQWFQAVAAASWESTSTPSLSNRIPAIGKVL